MTFSVNNKLVLEQYIKEGLRSERQNGIATPGQRDGVKGLKMLMAAKVNGELVPAGTIAYIREETLHGQQWAALPRKCDIFSVPFMLVDLAYVEFFVTPDDAA